MSRAVLIAPAVLAEIRRQARRGYPNEVCGVLVGRTTEDDTTVLEQSPAANRAAEPRSRFVLDPHDFLRADKAAEAAGLEVVGVWHSHPDGSAVPSDVDAETAWREYVYLIVSVTDPEDSERDEVRAWRFDGSRFVECGLGFTSQATARAASSDA